MARCRTWSFIHGAAFTAALALLMVGCGETEVTLFDDVTASPPLSVTYLLEGEATHGLRSLRATLLDLELLPEGEPGGPGSEVQGALPEPIDVDLVGLSGRARVLTTRYYGPGVYTRLSIQMAGGAVEAVDLAGTVLDVHGAAEERLILPLEEPLEVAAWSDSVGSTLVLRWDGDASLVSSVGSGPGPAYAWNPQISVRLLRPGAAIPAEDLWGGVVAVSDDRRIIQVASDASRTVGGRATPVNAAIYSSTLLFQADGQPAPNLGGIDPDPSLAEARFWVRGDYVHQSTSWVPAVAAESVLLDSLGAGEPSDAAFLLEARVLDRLDGGRFTFRPLRFKRGAEAGAAALAGVHDADAIAVDVPTGALVLGDDGGVAMRQDIRVGARVDLQFASFMGEPFQATRVGLLSKPQHCGSILSGGAGLGDWDLFLQPGAPALHAGLVASPATPVALVHGGIFAHLAVDGGRSVLIQDLASGLRVVATGEVGGGATAPMIEPAELCVLPGRFEGHISSISRSDASFTATVIALQAPLGGDTDSPPYRVFPAGSCAYRGDAESREELFAAFESLAPGESLGVRVAAIATENSNEVRAYEIQSRVR